MGLMQNMIMVDMGQSQHAQYALSMLHKYR